MIIIILLLSQGDMENLMKILTFCLNFYFYIIVYIIFVLIILCCYLMYWDGVSSELIY